MLSPVPVKKKISPFFLSLEVIKLLLFVFYVIKYYFFGKTVISLGSVVHIGGFMPSLDDPQVAL